MARGRQATQTPGRPAKARRPSLVASAAPVDITSKAQVDRIAKRAQDWQPEAWAYFDALGSVRDPLVFRSNVISKVDLFAAILPADGDDDPVPVKAAAEPRTEENDREPLLNEADARLADDTMDRLDDVSGLMRKLSLNFDVPGEAHVIGEEHDDGTETWRAYSTDEVVIKSGRYMVRDDPKSKGRALEGDPVVFRAWVEHPRWSGLSTSNMQALVNEGCCEELLLISREMRAASKSRIGKGLLLVAEELSLSGSTDDGTAAAELEAEEGGDEFQAEIIAWATETIAGEGTAYEVAPGVWRASSDMIASGGAVAKIDLGQPLDPNIINRANFLLDRIAQGINIPPEITKGMGDINHWGAWQVERAAFRSYMEPTVLAICQAMTIGFLRPLCAAAGMDPETVKRLVVWYDPSDALTPENRVEQATKGVENGALSLSAWREAAGWDDSDAPEIEEVLRRLFGTKTIMTAEMSLLIGKLIEAIPADAQVGQPQPVAPAPPRELPPAEQDEAPPEDETPAPVMAAGSPDVGARLSTIDRRLFDRTLSLADSALERAVEKAANKLRSAANRDASAKAIAAGTAGVAVGRALGRTVAAQVLEADDDDDELAAVLFATEFASLAEKVDALLLQAQQATVAQALAAGSVTVPDAELVQLSEDQAADRDMATDLLVAALVGLALGVLFDGRPAVDEGEFDPTATVPAGLVREVLAVGGGAVDITRTRAGGLITEGRPVGGVATGERSRQLFARVQAWWTGYRWEYGDAATRARPFPPHQALDGKEFARWDDPMLTNGETPWLGSISYTPGDHRGCQCSFVPIVLGET